MRFTKSPEQPILPKKSGPKGRSSSTTTLIQISIWNACDPTQNGRTERSSWSTRLWVDLGTTASERKLTKKSLSFPPPRRLKIEIEQSDEPRRSEEHTSELQSLMRISYAVFC